MKKFIPVLTTLLILSGCSSVSTDTTADSLTGITSQFNQTQNTSDINIIEPVNINNNKAQIMQEIQPTAFAVISTSKGDMKFKLFGEQAPELTTNFIELSKQGKYTDVPFHRVMKDFMVQGGDFEKSNGTGGYSYKGQGTGLADEIHTDLSHIYGALAWAKSSLPNSIGSQFYIVNGQEGAHFLDGGYSVFGLLVEGQKVLEKISNTPVQNLFGENSSPLEEILITSVSIEEL